MVDRRRPVSRFSDIVISIILSEAGALQLLAASRRRNDGLPGSMCPFLLSMIVADARGGIEFVDVSGRHCLAMPDRFIQYLASDGARQGIIKTSGHDHRPIIHVRKLAT
jgi:hypothetical protein